MRVRWNDMPVRRDDSSTEIWSGFDFRETGSIRQSIHCCGELQTLHAGWRDVIAEFEDHRLDLAGEWKDTAIPIVAAHRGYTVHADIHRLRATTLRHLFLDVPRGDLLSIYRKRYIGGRTRLRRLGSEDQFDRVLTSRDR